MAKKIPAKAAPVLYWTYQEAAAELKLSPMAIKRLCDRRELEFYLVSGKRRLDPVSVREWAARKRKPTLEELT